MDVIKNFVDLYKNYSMTSYLDVIINTEASKIDKMSLFDAVF